MRESSFYAREYREKYGRRPNPLTGVIHFLNYKSMMELIKQANSFNEGEGHMYKFSAYNLQGIADRERRVPQSKATIEFRQHQGTMDSNAILNWIETVVNIVDYIRTIDNISISNDQVMIHRRLPVSRFRGVNPPRYPSTRTLAFHGPVSPWDCSTRADVSRPSRFATGSARKPRRRTETESERGQVERRAAGRPHNP